MSSSPVTTNPLNLPSFDSTLGALYLGQVGSSVLYGITCVQTFLYATSKSAKADNKWHSGLVYSLFLLDTGHQICNTMALYRFLITDYLNPLALASDRTTTGGRFLLDMDGILGLVVIATVQLYFSWRLWVFARSSLSRRAWYWIPPVLAGALAILGFGSNIAIMTRALLEWRKPIIQFSGQSYLKADWLIALPAEVSCDVIISVCMVWMLYRSRTGMKQSDNVLKILIMFTVNTCLITTLLTIASLVTFIQFPNTTIYAGIEFMVPTSYVNSALASLNAREYLGHKMREQAPQRHRSASSLIKFAIDDSTISSHDEHEMRSIQSSVVDKINDEYATQDIEHRSDCEK